MIRIHAPLEGGGESLWLQYHHYPFVDSTEVLRRFPYRPSELTLPDGRVIEIAYSRQRRELPAPVALHDFEVVAHVGGFTGETSSIRDWVSRVRFESDNGWTDPEPVSMNKPANHRGFARFSWHRCQGMPHICGILSGDLLKTKTIESQICRKLRQNAAAFAARHASEA